MLTYTQRIEASGSRLVLTYAGNVDGVGPLRVRLPPGSMAGGVLRDGGPVGATAERVGDDVFVALETDWAMHRLEVALVPARGTRAPDAGH